MKRATKKNEVEPQKKVSSENSRYKEACSILLIMQIATSDEPLPCEIQNS